MHLRHVIASVADGRRWSGRRLVTVAVIVGAFLPAGRLGAQQPKAATRPTLRGALSLGKKSTGQLVAPEADRWTLDLNAGDFVQLEVLQQGIDIVVRVLAPAGEVKREIDNTARGSELARWLAEAGGKWTVELAPVQSNTAGAYEIRVLMRRVATEPDRQLLLSDSLQERALELFDRGDYADAEPLVRRALEIRETILGPEHQDVMFSMNNLGNINWRLGRYAEAESLHQRVLVVRERTLSSDDPLIATTLNNLGLVYWNQGRYADAERAYGRSLAIRERALGPSDQLVASVLNNLALVYRNEGRYADAETLNKRSLAILETALSPEAPQVALRLSNLGDLYTISGRYREAEPVLRRALAITEKALTPQHPQMAGILNTLGNLYQEQGRYAEAEPVYRLALAIREKTFPAEHPLVATSLTNLGLVYASQGRYAEAESLYRRSLGIREKTLSPEHPDVALGLNMLGSLYEDQGRYAQAESLYRRSLAISEKSLSPEHEWVAASLNNLATIREIQGSYAEAEPLYRRSLAIFEKAVGPEHVSVAQGLDNLARDLWEQRQDDRTVRPLLDRAIAILDAHPAFPSERVSSYELRARVRKQESDTRGALSDLAEAIRAAEELRPQVGGGEETRAGFFARFDETFERMVAWQLEAGNVERALEYAERGHARALLDQLSAGKIDLRASIPPDVRIPLEARETSARARLAEYQQRETLLRARQDLSDSEKVRQLASTEDSLRAVERDFRDVHEEIKNESPLWRDLLASGGQPVALATLQRRVVPERGLLLLYQVGSEATVLFVVPPAGERTQAVTLRIGREEARTLGVKPGALTAGVLQRVLAGDSAAPAPRASDAVAAMNAEGLANALAHSPVRSRGIGVDAAGTAAPRLHALWRVLVPEVLWRRLRAAEQVVVVPGRGLYLLPFEALVVKAGATPAQTRYWLDEGPPIRYAASATTLYNLEQRPAVRAVPTLSSASVLSLSDPIFDPTQLAPSIVPQAIPIAPTDTTKLATDFPETAAITRDSYVRTGGSLAPLPGTAAETEAIVEAFGGKGSVDSVLRLQRRDATEARLRAVLAGQGTRYLHLATHGLVDERRGSLFSALALTPPSSASASPEDDGFLQLHEIYELKLPEVELAVLSACATNAGAAVDGEGVFALSRGFLAAGARRVIASEWPVEDRSTAELMGHVFRGIAAAEQAGRPVSFTRVLWEAKRAVRGSAAWADPYFWAPFVLTGAR
jgi:tetratricopeptide (TPR) repeat protein